MDFREKLQNAAERGLQQRRARRERQAAETLSEEETRRLHSSLRLALTDHIEKSLHQLADEFPGFSYETVYGDVGWGGAAIRDDIELVSGRSEHLYSRMQIVVGKLSKYRVLDVTGKGTLRNKEILSRNFFQPLDEVNPEAFDETVDLWILEYAQKYAADG